MGAKCLEPEGKPWYNPKVHEALKEIAAQHYGDNISKAQTKEGASARRDFGRMVTYYINDQRCGDKRSYGETMKHIIFTIIKIAIVVSIILKIAVVNIEAFSETGADAPIILTNEILHIILMTALGLYMMIVFFPWSRPLPVLTPIEVVFIFTAGTYLAITAFDTIAEVLRLDI